jgi:translation elongation factor EF-1beta
MAAVDGECALRHWLHVDLAAMEKEVRAIEKEGLLWGTSRLMPVGFGIKKLQITAVIEDAKVCLAELTSQNRSNLAVKQEMKLAVPS